MIETYEYEDFTYVQFTSISYSLVTFSCFNANVLLFCFTPSIKLAGDNGFEPILLDL